MYSNLLLPHIASPTRVTAKSGTIIDTIFSNDYISSFTLGNLVTTLSDHHAQFLLMVSQTRDIDNENNHTCQDFTEIENNKNLISNHLESINWSDELRINRDNVDLSAGRLLKKLHQLINFWAPIQKVSNRKKKMQNKLWFTKGLQKVSNRKKKMQNKLWFTKGLLKSIESKNKLFKKMCRTKDTLTRQELQIKVKIFKKYILKLTRQSKANHFNNFFQENKLNLFKTWEGIREIINITKIVTNT